MFKVATSPLDTSMKSPNHGLPNSLGNPWSVLNLLTTIYKIVGNGTFADTWSWEHFFLFWRE